MIRTALRLGWLEIKLLVREPVTVVFALLLPLVFLFILGGVFGNEGSTPDEEVVWRGVGAMSFYVPAYLVLVAMSVRLVSIPTHLAGDRERGVLRRYRASAISVGAIAGAQLIVASAVSAVSSLVLIGSAGLMYDFEWPDRMIVTAGVLGTIVAGAACFGVLLGAVVPTARAAQAFGLLLWFVMMLLGGAGPPEEALTGAMRAVSLAIPMTHAVRMLHQPWLGLDPGLAWLTFTGQAVVSLAVGLRFFRWE
ncbi:MAG: ABC transporter permease [Acidimicrobiales bacterium]